MAAAQTIQAHIDDCGRRWERAEQTMRDLSRDFDSKHKENQENRDKDRENFDRFQKKLLVFVAVVLASIALKGTNLDILSHWISSL